jgi:hypothetical protein
MTYYTEAQQRVITRAEATRALRAMVAASGADPHQYALHSGRIGAATRLAAAGASDSAIMAAGRWKSTKFMVYVRASLAETQRRMEVLTTVA